MTVCGLLASAAVAAGTPATAAPDAPLKLAHSYPLPADIKGAPATWLPRRASTS
jgi:hypothetical protein